MHRPIGESYSGWPINTMRFATTLQKFSHHSKARGLATAVKLEQGSIESNSARGTADPAILLVIVATKMRECSKNQKSIECSQWESLNPPNNSGRRQLHWCWKIIAHRASTRLLRILTKWRFITLPGTTYGRKFRLAPRCKNFLGAGSQ